MVAMTAAVPFPSVTRDPKARLASAYSPTFPAVAAVFVLMARYCPRPTLVLVVCVSVVPSAIVIVALVAGAVNATLLTDVAVATPIFGVARVGDDDSTILPVPVTAFERVTPDRKGTRLK